MPNSENTKLGICLIIISAIAWSTAGLFTRLVSTDVPTTLFWRAFFGGFIVAAFWAFRHKDLNPINILKCKWGELAFAAWMAFGTCSFVAAFFYTDIANVAFVYGAVPVVTVLLNLLLFKQMPNIWTLAALLLCALGVDRLAGPEQNYTDLVGIGLAGIMTLVMGSIPVFVTRFPEYDSLKMSYWSAFITAFAMGCYTSSMWPSPEDFVWLALFGAVTIGFSLVLFIVGSSMVTPTTAATLSLTEIPLAPIWAALLFGEMLSWAMLIGGTLIWGSAMIQTRYGTT